MKKLFVLLFIVMITGLGFAQMELTLDWEVSNGAIHTDAGVINTVTGDFLVNEWDNASAADYVTHIMSADDGSDTASTLDNGTLTTGDFFAMAVSSDGQIYGVEGLTQTIAHWPDQASATPDEAVLTGRTGVIRGMKIVGTGNSSFLCAGAAGDNGACDICTTTDNGTTYAVTDTIAAPAGKSIHTMTLAGDVAYCGGAWDSDGTLKRFTGGIGAWTRDTSFTPTDADTAYPFSADYDEEDNVIIVAGYVTSAADPPDGRVCILDATTGATIDMYDISSMNLTYYGNVSLDKDNDKAYVVSRSGTSTGAAPDGYWARFSYGVPTKSNNWAVYE